MTTFYTTHIQLSEPQSVAALPSIIQQEEFETQPTQATFTGWQMRLINNLKHALAEAHTMMSLNMILRDAS